MTTHRKQKHYIQPESVEVVFRLWDGDKEAGERLTNGRFLARVEYYPDPRQTYIRAIGPQSEKARDLVELPLRPEDLRAIADAIERVGEKVRAAGIIEEYDWPEEEEE